MKTVFVFCFFYSVSSFAMDQNQMMAVVQSDLASLEKVKLESSSLKYKALFGPSLSGKTLVDFIRARIDRYEFGLQPNPNTTAQVTRNSRTTTIFPRYFEHSKVRRWLILLHEARHADPTGFFGHVACPQPFVFVFENQTYRIPLLDWASGSMSCDADDLGPYGLESAVGLNLAWYCENCSEKEKLEAWGSAFDTGLLRISDPQAAQRFIQDNFGSDPRVLRKLKNVFLYYQNEAR